MLRVGRGSRLRAYVSVFDLGGQADGVERFDPVEEFVHPLFSTRWALPDDRSRLSFDRSNDLAHCGESQSLQLLLTKAS